MKFAIKRLEPGVDTVTRTTVHRTPVARRKGVIEWVETPVEVSETVEVVRVIDTDLVFEEQPAPAPTLGGYLLGLKHETGFEHIAEPLAG